MGFYLVLVNLPAQLGRIHVFSFLVLVYLKAENISLFVVVLQPISRNG